MAGAKTKKEELEGVVGRLKERLGGKLGESGERGKPGEKEAVAEAEKKVKDLAEKVREAREGVERVGSERVRIECVVFHPFQRFLLTLPFSSPLPSSLRPSNLNFPRIERTTYPVLGLTSHHASQPHPPTPRTLESELSERLAAAYAQLMSAGVDAHASEREERGREAVDRLRGVFGGAWGLLRFLLLLGFVFPTKRRKREKGTRRRRTLTHPRHQRPPRRPRQAHATQVRNRGRHSVGQESGGCGV